MQSDLEAFARELAFGASAPDWLGLLRSYRWRGADWTGGVRTRMRFHQEWQEIQATFGAQKTLPRAFRRWADEITCDWAGLAEPIENAELQTAWEELRTGDCDKPAYFGTAHTAIAKLYAMADPKEWTNYDARLASALQALTAKRYPQSAQIPPVFQFAMPGAVTAEAFRASFAKASALVCTIAAILRHEGSEQPGAVLNPGEKRGDDRWQLWHIEMALFMLGQRARETRDA